MNWPSLTRANWIRIGGLIAICGLCLFHFNGLISGDEPQRLVRRVLPPALAGRLHSLVSVAPEARWAGCSLDRVQLDLDRITLTLRCEGRTLTAILTDAKTAGVPDSCLEGTTLSKAFGCRLTGDADGAKKRAVATALGKNLGEVFDGDPFVALIQAGDADLAPQRPHWDPIAPLRWNSADAITAAGLSCLFGFLWLFATGHFGFASLGRAIGVGDYRELVAIVPLILAVILRQGIALHSVEEIELQFFRGWLPSRHSVIYPMLQLFATQFARDPQALVLSLNGLVGSLAALPLYAFVRQRTASRAAAVLAASFYALQPVVARFAPTDGPYAPLLFFWFTGLAFLSYEPADAADKDPVSDEGEPGARALFAGGAFLGLAAACRMEGVLFLVASLFLLDVPSLLRRIRLAPRAAAWGCSAIIILVASHLYVLLPYHLGGASTNDLVHGRNLPLPLPSLAAIFRGVLVNADRMGPALQDPRHAALLVFRILSVVGAIVGVFLRRGRVATGALAGAFIVLAPFPESAGCVVSMHRAVPMLALQSIAAGVGLSTLVFLADRLVASQRLNVALTALGLTVPIVLLGPNLGDLRTRYVFNDEYEMVRTSLAPGGVQKADCTLLTFPAGPKGDIDIHDYGQIATEMAAVDCWEHDCLSRLSVGRCFYYVRSAACYYFEHGPPPGCAENGTRASDDATGCLDGPCARFERATNLRPVAERTVDIEGSFRDRIENYPRKANVGVYEVTGLKTH